MELFQEGQKLQQKIREEEERKQKAAEADRQQKIREEEERKQKAAEADRQRKIREEEERKQKAAEAERQQKIWGEEERTAAAEKLLHAPAPDPAPAPAAPAQNKNDLAAMLAQATPEQQKQMLGERLYMLIIPTQPQLASKITGMFLDHLETTELLSLSDSPFALDEKIKLALAVLPATAAQEEAAAAQKKVLCSVWPSPTPAMFTCEL
jgi:hypothetical protein